MVFELTIIIVLTILVGFYTIHIQSALFACFLFACFTLYWLPGFMFGSILELVFPSVLTRNINFNTNTNTISNTRNTQNQKQPIALTFDDVPFSIDSFRQLLYELRVHKAKATFFVISSYSKTIEHFNLLVDAVKEGHELANHGSSNSAHVLQSHVDFIKEFVTCNNFIIDVYKEARVRLPKKLKYRPGCGFFNSRMLDFINNYGNYSLALGSVYPFDPIIKSSVWNYWDLRLHINPGDIVILHDRAWCPKTVSLLLDWMDNNNLQSVTLNNLFGNKR